MKTRKAIMDCFNWLKYCIEIGWSLNSVDGLEELWWKYHDDNGTLLQSK